MSEKKSKKSAKAGSLFRVSFRLDNKKVQLYAGRVVPSIFLGLVQIEDITLKQEKSELLVDPQLDQIRREFGDSKVLHIPIQVLLRIEELHPTPKLKRQISKVVPINSSSDRKGWDGK